MPFNIHKIFSFLMWVFLPFMVIFLYSCHSSQKSSSVEPAYIEEIEQWHQRRIASLTKPDGWLSLVGLYWLKEGENRFGANPQNDIVFSTKKVPQFMGAFILRDSTVKVKINPGVEVFHQGKKVQQMILRSDADGKPTVLTYGTLLWYIIKRGDRFAVRLKDSNYPARKEFQDIERFPVDPAWRVIARFEPYNPPKTISIPTIIGTVEEERCPGALVFEINGKTYRLDPIGDPDDKQLFIIFADQTNGTETYGAGRFLYVDAPGPDGTTVIDFNKAYNPPCAFTPYATCPLPPDQNYLPIRVTAGEKKYGKGH